MSTTTRQLYRENISNGHTPVHIPDSPPAAAHFINRDLSLIEFFERVLDEALDSEQPLLERIKFLAIFSSNLDEFFQIRVSALKEKTGHKVDVSPDCITRPDLMEKIRERISTLIDRQMDCLRNEIIPELADNGIVLARHSTLSADERELADKYFRDKIYPVLTPQAVDPTHPFPYISGGSINLAFFVKPEFNKRVAKALGNRVEDFFVRIKIPAFVPRFVPIGSGDEKFILIEDLVAANIPHFAPEADPAACYTFRITRDADIDLRENEAADLLEMMEQNLKARRFGDVVRLEIEKSMPTKMAGYLMTALEIEEDDVYRIDGPMSVTDAFTIASLNRPELKDRDFRVTVPEIFQKGESTFEIIRRNDVLLHHPYMPYSHITDFLREAAEDPDVLAIKMCLYRIGADSPIAPLLIEASERGKQVTVLIEIKARFDEANNIEWGKRLERAGVHVVYGILGLKTHAKTTLIVRREGEELRRYVHLATGNYNPATSTVYTDLGLLTDDDGIGSDVTELFNYLTVYSKPEKLNKLLVAPINLRERMIEMIEREAKNAERGLPARIIAKINRLADARMVRALYKASQAGVKIDLIIRGICTLRPGVPGLSENITVRSIVGRLLEHSRVYYFENNGQGEIYLGSSDWMPRNLDRRVEVLAPIQDERMRGFLRDEYLEIYLNDNVKARELKPDGRYYRVARNENDRALNAQEYFQFS